MPNALSTFIVEYEVINKTVKPHVSITMDYAANALIPQSVREK
jgi:hypothetical protein